LFCANEVVAKATIAAAATREPIIGKDGLRAYWEQRLKNYPA
jgi:hypothetical protein